ncbi:YhgE/Pip domain-containing protein [Levilactobacillus parabrevis]|uniref:YhgE/Pip domain-containing protein n=1 Tax=Levilactobacillus parabrevis TaxID=357278 RepID=UPI0037571EBF
MLNVFKRKNIWLGMLAAIIIIGLFAFAQVGARSTVKLHHLPLALVVNDQGKDTKNVVKTLQNESRKKNAEIKWVKVKRTSSLTKGFAERKYYGAVVINSGFTQAINQQTRYLKGKVITKKLDVLAAKTPALTETQPFQQQKVVAGSLTSKLPEQAKISLYVSQGSNVTAANVLMTALPEMTNRLNQKITNQYNRIATKSGLTLTSQEWSSLQTPINATMTKRNSVSTKEISGMAPFLITIFCWLGSLIFSLLNWRDHSKNEMNRSDGRLSITSVTSQLISGIAIATVIAVSIYFFIKVCYSVPVHDPQNFLLLMGFIAFVFYALQSAVLDLLGLKGWPLLLVIWIGSMGVITFIPQMLSPFYHNYVYDITPIRFANDLITNQMYIRDASITGSSMMALLYLGLASIAVMYGSTLIRKEKKTA